jgi:PPOX class probable F420-dependent enzyme
VSSRTSLFADHKYINLETYRKSGEAVATPVWFTIDGDRIFVVTKSQTGKVKRLANNQKIRIMPCGIRGEPKGQWVDGKAAFLTPEELSRALQQRSKKYGLQAKLAGLFSSTKGELVGISIALD